MLVIGALSFACYIATWVIVLFFGDSMSSRGYFFFLVFLVASTVLWVYELVDFLKTRRKDRSEK